MDNCRKISLDIIDEVLDRGAYSNIVLNRYLNQSDMNQKDKALTTEIVYGTLKYKYTIDEILKSFLTNGFKSVKSTILNLLRISIYQLRYLDKIPEFAVVNESVNIAKEYFSIRESKLVNGVLRNYIRNKNKEFNADKNEAGKLAYKYSFPKWMVKMLIGQYAPNRCEKILEGLNKRPNVTVRVNELNGEYDEVFERLKNFGYDVEEGYICPEAIIINRGAAVEKNPLFREGTVSVQDESAMLVAPSMNLESGLKVLDLCSAPGGKTCHTAEIMRNTGEIKAFDIYDHKLKLIRDNAKRLGIKNVKAEVRDATVYYDELKDSAHRVLIDVPCSGLGIIRKKPEIKWTKSKRDMNELVEIQKKIMKNAAEYVKTGGYIIYSTCTLNKNENEQNIRWFLNEYNNFQIDTLFFGNAENIIYNKDGSATILPNEYMDGFFICRLLRKS